MSKSLVALVCAVLLSGAGSAWAQSDAALQPPALASARACLNRLADEGRKGNFDIEREGVDSLILDPSRDNIQPLQEMTAKCMDDAFPKVEIISRPGTGAKSRAWYAVVDGQYAWCATPTLTDDLDGVQPFGEDGPKKTWFVMHFNCAIGSRVLGWYDPEYLKPGQANAAPAANGLSGKPSAAASPQAVSTPEGGDPCAQAAVHWASTESIGTRPAYEDHLARFPNCAFATLAKVRIAALDQNPNAPASPANIAKNCRAGLVRDSDGDCVREKPPRGARLHNARPQAPARPRAAAENTTASPQSHALNCSDPAQIMACANKALSTLPH
jgi:hypothetical protein